MYLAPHIAVDKINEAAGQNEDMLVKVTQILSQNELQCRKKALHYLLLREQRGTNSNYYYY